MFMFWPNKKPTHKSRLVSVEAALVCLHTALHLKSLFEPEVVIYRNLTSNAKSNRPILPADIILDKESEKLEKLGLADFVKYGKSLIAKNQVSSISVVAGVTKDDTIRYTMDVSFIDSVTEFLKSDYLCTETVIGGENKYAKEKLTQIREEHKSALESIPEELLNKVLCLN